MPRAKIVTVVGARPQFVKAAALSPALARRDGVQEVLVHTGQHFDDNMSEVFFREMAIPTPDFHLGIGGGTHGQNTGRMIEAIEGILLQERPRAVVVFGDTDSTLAAAIAASKLGVELAHVESGLRSFRRAMPEEINRVVTDHVADRLYTPSRVADANLRREGIEESRILNTGDVMFDVLERLSPAARRQSTVLEDLGVAAGGFNLLTLHRKENVDSRERFAEILAGLASSPLPVLFPIHPRTAARLAEFELELPPVVRDLAPVGYMDFLCLQATACLVLTDSGGVQKEAYFHGVPCVTLRDETEWTELLDAGANTLAGADAERIARLLSSPLPRDFPRGLYGTGDAAERIAADLAERVATSGAGG